MGRRIDVRRATRAVCFKAICASTTGLWIGMLPVASRADLPAVSDPQATDRYRAAAAMQNRALYELAAAEWAAFASDYPADPLTASARFQRGVCLVQLQRFDEARAEFEALLDSELKLETTIEGSCRVQLGLARYNLALAAEGDGDARKSHLRAAIAAFDDYRRKFAADTLAADAAFYRCESLYALGKLHLACAGYREFLDRYPQDARSADARYALAVAQQEVGELAEAATTFEEFAAAFPEHASTADARRRRAESLLLLGQRHLAVGEAEEAVTILTRAAALPRWSHAADTLLALAESQLAAGDPQSAISTLDRLAAEWPEFARLDAACFCRGAANSAAENGAEAITDYARVAAEHPASELVPAALLAMARTQWSSDDSAAAEATLDRLLCAHAAHETALEARLLRATVRHERGDFAGGIDDADAILATEPQRTVRSDALYVRGLCQVGMRRPADAAESFEQIVARDPQCSNLDRVLYDLAWAYQESRQPEQATATFARLAEMYPTSPLAAESRYRVGEVRFAAGEFDAAAADFVQASEQSADPGVRERAAHKRAWCRFEQQDFVAAEACFAKQLESFPNGQLAADAQLMRGECRFRLRDYRQALQLLAAGLADSSASMSLRQSALLHAAQSAGEVAQWQDCLTHAERAIEEFPDAAWLDDARCERGAALFHLGRLAEAERALRPLAANRTPTGARAELLLGKILARRGDSDAALRTFFKIAYGYGEAEAAEPYRKWQAESLFEAARCLEATERCESAQKIYEELLVRFPASEHALEARTALQQTRQR